MAKLRLSRDVTLPLDAVTQTFAILGKRGSGKTNTASVLTEQMIGARLPVVYVDPIGVTWGLRHSRTGKSPGLPVIILGGEHADVPLEETGGVVIADFVIQHRAPVVLDLGSFSKGAQRRFMVDFAERLYHKNRSALHVMLDECDTFVPQRIDRGAERLVGAINDLVRKGRARGLGVSLISQRPALVNKDVLTQVEVLIAHRMTGPQDRDAIERWIEHNAEGGDDVLASLQKLEDGDAWVWSPSWLRLMKRTHVNLRETFDSSATPKAGRRVTAPKRAAEVDLGALREKLAATIEKAKEEDPRELRGRIAVLVKKVAELERQKPSPKVERIVEHKSHAVEVPVLSKRERKTLETLVKVAGRLAGALDKFERERDDAVKDVNRGAALLFEKIHQIDKMRMAAVAPRAPEKAAANGAARGVPMPRRVPLPTRVPRPIMATGSSIRGDELVKGERTILTAIVQHGEVTKELLTILTGHKKSSRDTYLSKLKAKGLIYSEGADILATHEGSNIIGTGFERLPTGEELRKHWLAKLPEGESRILQVVVSAYPATASKEKIGEQTTYKKSSLDTYISKLMTRKLVSKDMGGLRASDALFD